MGFLLKFKKNMGATISISVGLILLVIFIITGTTVVSHEEIKKENNNGEVGASRSNFNAKDFVEKTWGNDVIPFFEKNQTNASELLPKIEQSDLGTVGEESGIKVGNKWNFIINGKGKVLSVNAESRKGVAEIDLEPFNGESDFTLQIGPVFEGYAIRDVLDFIKFDDFNNQIEWSQLGSGFNTKTYQENLEGVTLEKGVELTFTGVLTADESSKLLTPVIIQKGGE